MKIIGAVICFFIGHKFRFIGPDMGMTKSVCKRCKRTKHERYYSSWFEMIRRTDGEID